MLRSRRPDLAPNRRPRWLSANWIVAGIAVVVALLVGGPWLWIHVVEGKAPEKLSLSSAPAAAAPSSAAAPSAGAGASSTGAATSAAASAAPAGKAGSLNGQWTVGPDSIAGYRVKETLFGQNAVAVGRTNDVTGDLTVADNAVTAAKFEVDMTTVHSDKSQRDGQFNGRIMDTSSNPKATFASTTPIAVPADAVAGKQFTAKVTGDLTLHGATKPVTFTVTGQKSPSGFDVIAQIPIVFADFGIDNPSFGPAKVGDEGTLEVLLKLTPKA